MLMDALLAASGSQQQGVPADDGDPDDDGDGDGDGANGDGDGGGDGGAAAASSQADAAAVTAAGHAGAQVEGGFFLKPCSTKSDRFHNEHNFLEALRAAASTDPMAPFAPSFHGAVTLGAADGSDHATGSSSSSSASSLPPVQYLRMGNLLRGFDRPHIMDVKMGVRCYEEGELASGSKPRADLFERMERMEQRLPAGQGHVLTDEERSSRKLTKGRWMQLRDRLSTTQRSGFRIDAVRTRDAHITAFNSDLFRLTAREDLLRLLRSFLPAGDAHHPRRLASEILQRLRELRDALRTSPLFASHEVRPRLLARAECLSNAMHDSPCARIHVPTYRQSTYCQLATPHHARASPLVPSPSHSPWRATRDLLAAAVCGLLASLPRRSQGPLLRSHGRLWSDAPRARGLLLPARRPVDRGWAGGWLPHRPR